MFKQVIATSERSYLPGKQSAPLQRGAQKKPIRFFTPDQQHYLVDPVTGDMSWDRGRHVVDPSRWVCPTEGISPPLTRVRLHAVAPRLGNRWWLPSEGSDPVAEGVFTVVPTGGLCRGLASYWTYRLLLPIGAAAFQPQPDVRCDCHHISREVQL